MSARANVELNEAVAQRSLCGFPSLVRPLVIVLISERVEGSLLSKIVLQAIARFKIATPFR
jgi:hypothetical protein